MVEFVLRVDAAKARPYRKMIDVTGVTTRFSADRIRCFAEVIRQREEESEVGPIGVVAGSPDAHRQAILFARQAQWHRPIKVFHSSTTRANGWMHTNKGGPTFTAIDDIGRRQRDSL